MPWTRARSGNAKRDGRGRRSRRPASGDTCVSVRVVGREAMPDFSENRSGQNVPSKTRASTESETRDTCGKTSVWCPPSCNMQVSRLPGAWRTAASSDGLSGLLRTYPNRSGQRNLGFRSDPVRHRLGDGHAGRAPDRPWSACRPDDRPCRSPAGSRTRAPGSSRWRRAVFGRWKR